MPHLGWDHRVQLTLVHELGVELEAGSLGVLVSEYGLDVHCMWLSILRPGIDLLAPHTGKPRLRFSGESSLGLVVIGLGLCLSKA